MNRILLGITFFTLITQSLFSQVTDTVYFDLEGEIIIKEVASYYRIAEFDTLNGFVLGEFNDYLIQNDSLIAFGLVNIDSLSGQFLEKYKGDTNYYAISHKMLDLQSSYIRINDYPVLKKVIKPTKNLADRINLDTPYGQARIVELRPEFNGGFDALGWFISQLITFPEEAENNNITGTVKLKFQVDIDGSIKKISVMEGIGYGCDEEAIRVMKLIPDWLPGLQQGKPVKVYFSIPIGFQ